MTNPFRPVRRLCLRHWDFGILSSLGFRHLSFTPERHPAFDVQRSMLNVRCSFYSYRSAPIGSARAARKAGIRHAANATPIKTNTTLANVIGSVGVTE